MRVLIIGHASAAESAAAAAREAWPTAELDALSYGRGAGMAPPAAGIRSVGLPGRSPRAAARWLAELRRARYDVTLVAQPNLPTSRARGALLGAALAVGPRRVIALDLERSGMVGVRTVTAAVDSLRFCVLVAGAWPVAATAALVCRRAARAAPAEPIPASGPVVYLRTDLDLDLAPLTAGGSLAHTAGIIGALERRSHPVEVWSTGEMSGVPAAGHLPVVRRANVPWELSELASGLRQALSPRPARPRSRSSTSATASTTWRASRWPVVGASRWCWRPMPPR